MSSTAATNLPRSGNRSHIRPAYNMQDVLTAYGFLAPAMIVFLVFLILPIFFALYISFTDWNGISPLTQVATGASGIVTFTNNTDTELSIPAGTIITTAGDALIQYETSEDAVLSAGIGETLDVLVRASDDSLGAATNIAARRVTVVEGPLDDQLSAENALPITGGVAAAFQMVGLQNYTDLLFNQGLAQRDFFLSFKNTVYFVLGVVPIQTVLALILAVILNQKWLRAKGAFRTAFYFPSVTSSVVISIIFMWMFSRSGLVNLLLGTLSPGYQAVTWLDDPNGLIHNFLGLLGITRQNAGDWASTRMAGLTLWDWISGPSVTMFTIMLLNTWTTIGTLMVIYLAALQGIPGSLYEAAQIDGANGWQTFRRITIPLLAPTTFFVVTLGLIGTFQVFDQIFVISSGGPAKTTLTIAYIVYENGFNNSRMGLAAATALILFLIIFAFTLVQRRFTSETANI